MAKKTYQEQMNNSYPNYPIVKSIPASMAKTWGEGMQVLPSPLEIYEVMKTIPLGKVMTSYELCDVLAKKHNVDMACPYTVGILTNIVARAIEEDGDDETPWWRILGSKGELKSKYPNATQGQKVLLKAEGHKLIKRGEKEIFYVLERYYS